MLKAVCQAFGICCGNAILREGDIHRSGRLGSVQRCSSCRCARDAPEYDAIGTRQAADAVGAVHAACCLTAGVEALNARVRGLVDFDTAVGGVGIHRHAHLVGRRDAVLVL